jgi:hypothetical protein
MHRMITCHNIEIHVELIPVARDMFDATVQIEGGTNVKCLGREEIAYSCATAPSLNDGRTSSARPLDKLQSTYCLALSTDLTSPGRLGHFPDCVPILVKPHSSQKFVAFQLSDWQPIRQGTHRLLTHS